MGGFLIPFIQIKLNERRWQKSVNNTKLKVECKMIYLMCDMWSVVISSSR